MSFFPLYIPVLFPSICVPSEHEKSLFKIVGAKGRAAHNQPYVIYRLKDNQDTLTNINERREEYEPTRVTEIEPEVVLI